MGPYFAPFYQTYVRSFVIILLMAPILYWTGSFRKILRKDWLPLGVFITFCICTQVPLYFAFNHAPIGVVQFIFYALFIISAYVMGKFYLAENITKIKLISMAIALSGLVLVFGISSISFAVLGIAHAAFNGIASGSENTSSKKLTNTYPPGLIIFWGWVATLITHLPISMLLHEPQPLPSLSMPWVYLFVYCVVNAAAFWIGLEGFKHVDASIGSVIGLTEVLFAAVFGYLIFHEHFAWTVGAGGVLIIVAAMLPDAVNILKHKHPDKPIEPIMNQ